MKKILLALVLVAPLAACDSTQAGLIGGAALGAALDDDNPGRGAVVGAAIGGVTGAVVDQNRVSQ
ncbi:YMGG-like glycine zipper-containing protein [Roseobacteraceae bacterium S113]